MREKLRIRESRKENARENEKAGNEIDKLKNLLGLFEEGKILNLVQEIITEQPELSFFKVAEEIQKITGKSSKSVYTTLTLLERQGIIQKGEREDKIKIENINWEKARDLWDESDHKKILEFINEKGNVTIKEIQENFRFSSSKVRKIVRQLKEKKLIKVINFGIPHIICSIDKLNETSNLKELFEIKNKKKKQ